MLKEVKKYATVNTLFLGCFIGLLLTVPFQVDVSASVQTKQDSIQVIDSSVDLEIIETLETNQVSAFKVDTDTIDVDKLEGISISGYGLEVKEVEVETQAERKLRIELEETRKLMAEQDRNVYDGVGVCNSANFTYMYYTAVTAKSSPQYKLLNGENAYTDPETGCRMVDGRYCIAVGSGYCSTIGTKIDILMENGTIIQCIMGDAKADCHTDAETHTYQAVDGSVVEMIVDKAYFKGTSHYPEGLKGRIQKVLVLPN